jgi:hypothetical protein
MKKAGIFLVVVLSGYVSTYAQGPYNLSSVPESVKNKAAVITHLENTELIIESLDKATLNVHKVFTVLNETGKNALLFNKYTSKYVSLDDVEIRVYDAAGKQIEKVRKKDMATTITGEGLIEEGNVTFYPITALSYPVTVDLKYEEKFRSTLVIPDYRFIRLNEGVVESNFTVKVPTGIGLRYKAKHSQIEPQVIDEGKNKIYKWAVRNLAPIDHEEGSVGIESRYPHIAMATDHFSHYGFQGELTSWKSFGTWINQLYNGLDILPENRRQFFMNLVKDTPGEKEKIKKIYQYMQENFRYVSIQLGIGGLRPFSAEFTDQKKYGDCKGLSNYMKAALGAIGIKSHVAIINAEYNQEPVDPDFPSNGFNHVILCVPGQMDSTWLECTSSTAEFGVLGTFTENRNALLITEKGGVLVPTPKSHAASNYLSTVTTVTLADDLSAETKTDLNTRGEFKELVNSMLKDAKDRQKYELVQYFGFKQPDEFVFMRVGSESNKANLSMILSKVPGFSSGSKLFISPRINKMWLRSLPKAENRKLDYYFPSPFEQTDTTIYKLPPGAKPDALPKETDLKCDYATYKTRYWFNESENSIYSTTSLVLKQHKIPASGYAAVKKFFDDVMQDDSQKMVIQKAPATEKKAF